MSVIVVVILIVTGILLIALNFSAVLKEKKTFQYQLDLKQSSMEDYKLEISKVRKEFSETIFRLQKEIEDLKCGTKDQSTGIMLYNGKGKKITENVSLNDNNEKDILVKIAENQIKDQHIENSNNIKIHKIRELLKQGMSIDEISEETGIDKGEVLLIKELYTE
ncbi:hypothetical protein ACJDU8_07985 [Clostridium sp. WILCCON 0269]|uniref:DUF2802 domain-containing protein n=1 Tax=Candidatus Clostridium eludens TaxID=3381663 RepID=A0ABW8SJY6_9CLOT